LDWRVTRSAAYKPLQQKAWGFTCRPFGRLPCNFGMHLAARGGLRNWDS
jgi:hypothetical protein